MTESIPRYKTILKNIHDGVYTLDPDGRITWVNETAVEEFDIGYDRDDLIGAYVSKVLSDEDIEKCLEIIRECLQIDGRQSGRCQIALQTAAGDEIPCELHLALLPFDDGEFQGTVGVIRDITERQRREQRLEVLNRLLRHNLRNDMNVILGHAQKLAAAIDGNEYARDVRMIRETGNDLLELSEKARRMAQIRETTSEDREAIDVIERLQRILAEFRGNYSHVEFTLDVPPDVDTWTVLGHEELFVIIVQNLIENAIKHNESSQPRVSVSVHPGTDRTQVRIRDNGPGLPEMEQEVLETGSETPLQHSSGLGLWLAQWCVTESGGDISFDQANPQGTIVTLDFPTLEDPIRH